MKPYHHEIIRKLARGLLRIARQLMHVLFVSALILVAYLQGKLNQLLRKVWRASSTRPVSWIALLLLSAGLLGELGALTVKLKDIAKITNMRENQLVGYGLVVGLPGSGDSKSILAQESLKKILSYRGIKVPEHNLKSRNIAAVMVMARVPAFARVGDSIDVWVSSIGDAKSLKDGYLMQTPLMGADSKTYAVAQAGMSPAMSSGSGSSKKTIGGSRKRVPATTVHVPAGAVMERAVTQSLSSAGSQPDERVIRLSLLHFDINTAQNTINAINQKYAGSAKLGKDGTITVVVPGGTRPLGFVAGLLDVAVEVKSRARVVIDPRSATIVMGENVSLSSVSITKNGISIKVGSKTTEIDAPTKSSTLLPESPNVSQLVNALNELGLAAEDIIDILKAIHAAGALHADLVIL